MSQDKNGFPVYGPPQPGFSAPPPPGFNVGPQTGFVPPPYSQAPQGYPPAAGYGKPVYHPGPPPSYHDSFNPYFEDAAVRKAFIRKVFLTLTVQLLVTFQFVAVFSYVHSVKHFVMRNPWMLITSSTINFIIVILLCCCGDFHRKHPGNLIALSVLTLSLSFNVAFIASSYDTEILIMAVGITAVVCFSVVLFSLQTKYDFTPWSAVLLVLAIVLIGVGFLSLFISNKILHIVYAVMGVLIFTCYLAVDTQRLLGNKKLALSPDEYIFAALTLYLDIIYIFIFILRLLGGFRDD